MGVVVKVSVVNRPAPFSFIDLIRKMYVVLDARSYSLIRIFGSKSGDGGSVKTNTKSSLDKDSLISRQKKRGV